MSTTVNLYDQDFYAWTQQQAKFNSWGFDL